MTNKTPGDTSTKASGRKRGKKCGHLPELLAFDQNLSKSSSNIVLIGIDEVGRGCLAGPVVAGAAILPELGPELKAVLECLNDSKLLDADLRDELSLVLTDICIHAIGEATVEEIDEINILQATYLAMRRALSQLNLGKESVILVDGNRPIPDCPHKQIQIVKGDSKSASIAAASVIAKVHRDRFMCQLSEEHPQYAWHSNKGYASKTHTDAILAHGISKWHRKTFCRSFEEGKQLSLF